MPQDTSNKIKNLYEQGYTDSEISRELGISTKAPFVWRKERNLKVTKRELCKDVKRCMSVVKLLMI